MVAKLASRPWTAPLQTLGTVDNQLARKLIVHPNQNSLRRVATRSFDLIFIARLGARGKCKKNPVFRFEPR